MHAGLFLASTSLFAKFLLFKTYNTSYFRKQQNETGHFCAMTYIYQFLLRNYYT